MVFRKIWNFLTFWYFQYTLNTSLYMMEPIERKAFNNVSQAMRHLCVSHHLHIWSLIRICNRLLCCGLTHHTPLTTMETASRMMKRLRHYYFVYSVNSSVYMLEPVEEVVVNTILIAVIAMVLYTSYLFLPGHALMIIHFLTRLLGGQGEEEAATIQHRETS